MCSPDSRARRDALRRCVLTRGAAEPDTFSPVVSYQYHDTLAEPGTSITSPVASYQYFEWPGDENLTFSRSPSVSYSFSGGISTTFSGVLRDSASAPLAGATVVLTRWGTVFWQGTTNASGFFSASNIQATNYTIMVSKPGYRTLTDNIAGYAGGTGTLALTMATLPVTLPPMSVERTPPPSAFSRSVERGRLQAYSSATGGFVDVDNSTLFRDRMTILLTHGKWNSPATWAREMAGLIRSRNTLSQQPNIVAWDWHEGAAKELIDQIHLAAQEGFSLGVALQQALGTDYS